VGPHCEERRGSDRRAVDGRKTDRNN